MKILQTPRFRQLLQWKKWRLPLRLQLALWSAGLVLILSFGLLLFINIRELGTFPRIIRLNEPPSVSATQSYGRQPTHFFRRRSENVLERALLLELRSVSLTGLLCVSILGGAGAYWLAGIALRPVRRVSAAARRISANTLHTRLARNGPKDEIKELSDTFDAMLGRLERTFEQQGRFIGDIAHELRTPLASLRTNLEVVTSDEGATLDDYRVMAATQERALTRLERLVADLLILARSEQPATRGEVTLESLLEEVIAELKQTADARKVRVQLLTKAEVIIPGDESLLARVFSNLVENAIHYNQPGGEVMITIDRKEGWAVVIVADTGIGIPAEKQAHIFERFYRVDSSRARHQGGAGLGLSIVAAIVQQHGGQVHVESTPAIGTTFTVLLPL
jgi:heavy metal sensor kinase